ncbi:Metal transporter CNNM2 [Hypsibius exemplaris]|uniref:Metal transporter CNNM2 n=1 Tax=Hypsibius exemplaris TaxID=2072580 RepID=A0A1W0XF31_HYPEX|nr:Metal transporter CNNM2 [Hypsibius exemplaris]
MVKSILLLIIFQCLHCSGRQPGRERRQAGGTSLREGSKSPQLSGFRVESDDCRELKEGNEEYRGRKERIAEMVANVDVPIRIFGSDLTNGTSIKFTSQQGQRGQDCAAFDTSRTFPVEVEYLNGSDGVAISGFAVVNLELLHDEDAVYYFCISDPEVGHWIHQGTSGFLKLRTVDKYFMPLWAMIVLIILLQCLSGLFSGLNLGLLSLDPTELQIVASVGGFKEKIYAKHIIPLRKKGNFLLCSLVISNALANSLLTIMLDTISSGMYAVIFSTIGIVLFGEIVPQALCNRFGLAIGSATRYITYVVMAVTAAVSFPLSKLLDFLLGREIGTVYDRERLVELIRVTMDHNLLESDEVNIISGTLSLKRKKVGNIMTPLDDVFMLPYDAVLDFDTLSEITREGYTRMPVYETNRANIVGLLNIKDLALLDPDDGMAVKTLCKYYSYELVFVTEETTLDVMLEDFKKGHSHMAFIQQYHSDGEHDPTYKTIGVVTLEDIIEEMIQAEIYDESDKNAQDKKKPLRKDNLSVFSSRPLYSSLINPQLQHAAFQFLSTSVEPFRAGMISEQILHRLIHHGEVARLIRRKPTDVDPAYIFQAGRPADYFVLILEGRVEVKVGFEGLIFESGPFTYFGVSALAIPPDELALLSRVPFPALPSPRPSQPRINLERTSTSGVFVPDFTVIAHTDVLFLRIKRSHYVAGIRATILEQQKKAGITTTVEDTFGQEMDRCAKEDHSLGGDFAPAIATVSLMKMSNSMANSTVDLPLLRVPNSDPSYNPTTISQPRSPHGSSNDLEMLPLVNANKDPSGGV